MVDTIVNQLVASIISGLVGGVVAGVAAWSAIKVELRYLRRDVDDTRTRVTRLEGKKVFQNADG